MTYACHIPGYAWHIICLIQVYSQNFVKSLEEVPVSRVSAVMLLWTIAQSKFRGCEIRTTGKKNIAMEPITAKGRILVLDDEEFIRSLLVHALSAFGFKALASSHGAEAIELFEVAQKSGRPFDGLIMDIHIRNGMGGVEAMNRLLEIDPGVKAMVSSSDINHPAMINYKDYGFKGFLTKPYSFKELQQELEKLIKE